MTNICGKKIYRKNIFIKILSNMLVIVLLLSQPSINALFGDYMTNISKSYVDNKEWFYAYKVIGDVQVSVCAEPGVFPKDARLSVNKIEDDEKVDEINKTIVNHNDKNVNRGKNNKKDIDNVKHYNKIDNKEQVSKSANSKNTDLDNRTSKEIRETYAYDITLYDKKGKEIQPDNDKGEVRVVFKNIKDLEDKDSKVSVYHINDNLNKAESMTTDIASSSKEVSIKPKHFSIYTVTIETMDVVDNKKILKYNEGGTFNSSYFMIYTAEDLKTYRDIVNGTIKEDTIEELMLIFESGDENSALGNEYNSAGTLAAKKAVLDNDELMPKNARLYENINLGGIEWDPIGTNEKPYDNFFYGANKEVSNFTLPTGVVASNDNIDGLFGKIQWGKVQGVVVNGENVSYPYWSYKISKLADLNNYAKFINGEFNGLVQDTDNKFSYKAEVTANISITDVKNWKGIGTKTRPFSGDFTCADGKSITFDCSNASNKNGVIWGVLCDAVRTGDTDCIEKDGNRLYREKNLFGGISSDAAVKVVITNTGSYKEGINTYEYNAIEKEYELTRHIGISQLSGAGTEDKPYLISNEENFSYMINMIKRNGYVIGSEANTNALTAYYKLERDIIVSDWKTICPYELRIDDSNGSILDLGFLGKLGKFEIRATKKDRPDYARGFKGTLDGNNCTISGINGTSGFMGHLNAEGVIKNLNLEVDIVDTFGIKGGLVDYSDGEIINCNILEGSKITSTNASFTNRELARVGGLVGWHNSGNISKCSSNATINYPNATVLAGGLVGVSEAGTISESKVIGGSVTGKTAGNAYLGGFIGRNVSGKIINCYVDLGVTGDINVNNLVSSNKNSCGGFAGAMTNNNGKIYNCYTICKTKNGYGFIGNRGDGYIKNCYSADASSIQISNGKDTTYVSPCFIIVTSTDKAYNYTLTEDNSVDGDTPLELKELVNTLNNQSDVEYLKWELGNPYPRFKTGFSVADKPVYVDNGNGTGNIYAKGYKILIQANSETGNTEVLYYDVDANGNVIAEDDPIVIETEDRSKKASFSETAGSGITVFGGDVSKPIDKDISITMLSGTIGTIYGGGNNRSVENEDNISSSNIGTININILGGTVGTIYGGSYQKDVIGDIHIDVSGNANITTLYGGGYAHIVDGNTYINVVDTSTVGTIYGGGQGAAASVSSSFINVEGGIITNVYGGSNTGTVEGSSKIEVTGGTITNIYGCGNGSGTNNQGTVRCGSTITLTGGRINNVTANGEGGVTATSDALSSVELGGNVKISEGVVLSSLTNKCVDIISTITNTTNDDIVLISPSSEKGTLIARRPTTVPVEDALLSNLAYDEDDIPNCVLKVVYDDVRQETRIEDDTVIIGELMKVSVDISWGNMSMTYKNDSWNPSTHKYDAYDYITDGNNNKISIGTSGDNNCNIKYSLVYNYNLDANLSSNITGKFIDEDDYSSIQTAYGTGITNNVLDAKRKASNVLSKKLRIPYVEGQHGANDYYLVLLNVVKEGILDTFNNTTIGSVTVTLATY